MGKVRFGVFGTMYPRAEPEYAVNWQTQISDVVTRLGGSPLNVEAAAAT